MMQRFYGHPWLPPMALAVPATAAMPATVTVEDPRGRSFSLSFFPCPDRRTSCFGRTTGVTASAWYDLDEATHGDASPPSWPATAYAGGQRGGLLSFPNWSWQ